MDSSNQLREKKKMVRERRTKCKRKKQQKKKEGIAENSRSRLVQRNNLNAYWNVALNVFTWIIMNFKKIRSKESTSLRKSTVTKKKIKTPATTLPL